MSDDLVKRLRGHVTTAAHDLIDRYFGNTDKCLATIPADPDRDADLVLTKGLKDAADRIEELEAKLAKAVAAGVGVAGSLAAAISLLERGGKKAAPSDKMFNQMLVDYEASLDQLRTTLAELTGGKDE